MPCTPNLNRHDSMILSMCTRAQARALMHTQLRLGCTQLHPGGHLDTSEILQGIIAHAGILQCANCRHHQSQNPHQYTMLTHCLQMHARIRFFGHILQNISKGSYHGLMQTQQAEVMTTMHTCCFTLLPVDGKFGKSYLKMMIVVINLLLIY